MTEADVAERLLQLHRLTRRRFDQPVLGDPAMVILLELLLAGRHGLRLSEAGLAEAAGLPPPTARRFVAALEQQGLVGPSRDGDRAGELGLTPDGEARLGQLLRDWQMMAA